MGVALDSLGLDLVAAGLVIALAGIFLTPMRTVVVRGIRSRLGRRAGVPEPAPDAEIQPEAVAEAPAAPADGLGRPAPVEVPASYAARTAVDLRGGDYRDQEALFARTLLTAQKTAEDLVRNAQAEAYEILARAEAAANETARASRKNASEILQKAQQDADLIVASAKRNATAWLTLVQAEADKLAAEAHQAFQGAQRSVAENAASLASRLERRMAEWNAHPWEQRIAPSLNGAADPSPEPPAIPSDPGGAERNGVGHTTRIA